MTAPLPRNEDVRLRALRDCRVLDTPPEDDFDDITRLAAHICDVPIAAISLIDAERQWFKSIIGLALTETPRSVAFCAHTILQAGVMVVPDAQADARFADNPLVTGDRNIRFYAGAPLVTEDGYALGSLCVIDRTPKQITAEQGEALRLLARLVTSQLEKARRAAERERAEQEMARLAAIVESSEEAILAATLDGTIVSWNRGAERLFGYAAAEMVGRSASMLVGPEGQSAIPAVVTRLLRGEVVGVTEVTRTRRDGSGFHAALSFSPIRDAAGYLVGLSCIARDITAQKWAEAALAESEARLRRLTDAAFEGIAISQGGVLVDVSPAYAAMFGYAAPTEMVGLTISTVAAPASRALVLQKVADCDENPYEATLLRRNGSTFPAELRGRLIHLGGQPARVTAVRDISERRAMEQSLRASQRFAHSIAENSASLIFVLDLDTQVNVYANRDMGEFLGYTPDRVAAMGAGLLPFLIHPDDLPHRKAHFGEFDHAQNGQVLEFEYRARHADGGWRWICSREVVFERHADGRPWRILGNAQDVTPRKALEADLREQAEQLRRSEAALRAVLESAPVILYAADAEGTVTLSEGTGLAALGLKPGEAVGRSVFDFNEGIPELEANTRRAMAGEAVSCDAQVYGLCLHTELRPLRDADGAAAGIIGVCFDVTERKRAEETVKDHAAMLESRKLALEKANIELEALATTDGMTGLKNHRAFQEQLAEEVSRAGRYHAPLSLVLLDVDRFKDFNDAFGHPAGDAVLKAVARVLQAGARETDLVARYGGEEFVLLLPQTDAAGAALFAERLRAAIEAAHWPLRAVTASFGVACLQLGADDGDSLITRADDALYLSKAGGRNRVTASGSHPMSTATAPSSETQSLAPCAGSDAL